MIVIFIGEQNSGKTLSMTYFLYRYYLDGFKVFSNYNLMFKHEKINKEMLEDFTVNRKQLNKSVISLDEIYLFLDSRSFGKKFNKIFSYFILQSSKNDCHIIGTCQYFNTVEKRFRENTNIMVFCERVMFNEDSKTYEPINTNIRMINPDNLYIKNTFIFKKPIDILNSDYFNKTFYLKAQPIFKLYNTKELLNIE